MSIKEMLETNALEVVNFCNDRLSIYNVGDDFTSEPTSADLNIADRGIRYRDAVQIIVPSGEYWLFDYGVIVFWGVDEVERKQIINRMMREDCAPREHIDEHFRFSLSNELKVNSDIIQLPDIHHLTRLAISHALAQSIKLTEFEQHAQDTITRYAHLPKTLAETGKIPLKRKDTAKIRGELFSTKSDIILHYGLLDTPEFFWEFPEYEVTYNTLARYMDIHPRVELLSTKLSTIHELFDMLADEQKHQHSSFLEWIIIWLIAIEIVIYFVEETKKSMGS